MRVVRPMRTVEKGKTTAAKRWSWREIVTALLSIAGVYVGGHFAVLAVRSHAAEERLIRALTRDGDSVPLTTLVSDSDAQEEAPSLICILPPYSEPKDVPELADVNFGLDFLSFEPSDEYEVIAVLDAKGDIASFLRLSTWKIELDSEARCYRPKNSKLIRKTMGDTLSLTIKDGWPNQ